MHTSASQPRKFFSAGIENVQQRGRARGIAIARRVCGLVGGAAPVEIASSPGLGEAENAARLVQVGQVLQLGLEVQAFQVEEMENDYADKVDALAQELETVERENDELEDQLDAAQGAPGNVGELAEVVQQRVPST